MYLEGRISKGFLSDFIWRHSIFIMKILARVSVWVSVEYCLMLYNVIMINYFKVSSLVLSAFFSLLADTCLPLRLFIITFLSRESGVWRVTKKKVSWRWPVYQPKWHICDILAVISDLMTGHGIISLIRGLVIGP